MIGKQLGNSHQLLTVLLPACVQHQLGRHIAQMQHPCSQLETRNPPQPAAAAPAAQQQAQQWVVGCVRCVLHVLLSSVTGTV